MNEIHSEEDQPLTGPNDVIGSALLSPTVKVPVDVDVASVMESPSVSHTLTLVQPEYAALASTVSTLLLAFILILCLWDTWSTFTDIVSPIEEALLIRCILNAGLCVVGYFLVTKCRGRSKRLVILGNLLGGIGLWELVESIIEDAFDDDLLLKFFFYLSCLILTYGLVMYLEATNRLSVINSGFMSPL